MKSTILWMFLTVFSLSKSVTSYNYGYLELLELGGSCYPRDSCSTLKAEEDDNLWNNRTCECGQHCLTHRTCCIDSPYVNHEPDVSHPEREECQTVQTSSKSVMMISHCSSRWSKHSEVYNKCETNPTLEDPVAEAPVTSLTTATTYKNYFCGMCNYESEKTVLWDIGIKTDTSMNSTLNDTELLQKLVYNSGHATWGVSDIDSVSKKENFLEVKIEFKAPTALLKFIKKCYPRIVSQCNALHWNDDLYGKCNLYYAPVKLRSYRNKFIKYRNIHCALCNDLNVSQVDVDICKLDREKRKPKPSLSFALLLDVNSEKGAKVGMVQACRDGQVFDPFFKKCRSMTCALPGYVVKSGSCSKA